MILVQLRYLPVFAQILIEADGNRLINQFGVCHKTEANRNCLRRFFFVKMTEISGLSKLWRLSRCRLQNILA